MDATIGKTDLTNCDREPIHIPGSIQPHGALIAFDVSFTQALRHSANAPQMLALAGAINGARADELLGGETTHALRNALGAAGEMSRPALLFNRALSGGNHFDIAVHRHQSSVIVEFEPAGNPANQPLQVAQAMIDRLRRIDNSDRLIQAAARLVRGVLGYDRVMIYQFERDGAGKVIAEMKRGDLESFLGQYFPASDIPQQARALYLKNAIRVISSSSYEPIPLVPQFDLSGEALDLTFAHLRSVSPIHLEYLRNMGVGASMSISIIVDGELWGLIACHHYSPRILPMALRAAAEMFGDFFSLHLNALKQREKLHVATEARSYLDRVLKLASSQNVEDVLIENLDQIGHLIPNDGYALYFGGRWKSAGSAPSSADGPALAQFIGTVAQNRIWATHSLVNHYPAAEAYYQDVSGVLAIPLSQTPRDYLFFFRKELVQTLNWAGNPDKSYTAGPLGDRLTPRKSFAIWKETVERQAQPWTESDREIAGVARTSLVEVALRHNELLEQERSKADVRQRMLNEELNHRVKNILSVIKSLVGQPVQAGRTIEDYVSSLRGRIQALSFAHDQVVRGEGGGALSQLVKAELSPYRTKQNEILVDVEKVWIDSRAYSVLALVLHELATNAAKYGSLSTASGKLAVTSHISENGDCLISWVERGGPPVSPPSREGFGTALLDRSIPYDLGGESTVQYLPEGLNASFRIPARHVRRKQGDSDQAASMQEKTSRNTPQDVPLDIRLLLLEDQMLIAMDVEGMLADRGFANVSTVNSAAEAMKLIDRAPPSLAILDVNLGDGTSLGVAERLQKLNIPFVFATGYGDGGNIAASFPVVPIVRKPYSADSLVQELRRAFAAGSPGH
ncbi:HWE histidine kinase domain-containing protein [Aestuariivirga sp.]|uniref:HWE histidine kinase domain-containing protein n=1 Tax=Aestuariivirga sp. TaxID=2650926 RepID=UPI0039E382E2